MTAGKWAVTRAGAGLWRVWDGDGYHRSTYPTWTDAMKNTDRMARTVTVVLPRLAPEEWTTAGEPVDAADTLEYRVEHQHIDGGLWHPATQWSPEYPFHEEYYKADDERVVCRRVSEPWEVTNE